MEKVSSSKRNSTSTYLVIGGGLAIPTEANPRKLVAVVLGLVHRHFDISEIVCTRLLVSKAMVSAAFQDADSSSPTIGTVGPNPTNASELASTAPSTTALPRSPSVLVTLKTHPLLLAIVSDIVKMGKLHTSALASVQSDDVDFNQIKPNHININEFLPKDAYMMYRKVSRIACKPNSVFVSFIRSGNIYVRKKKDSSHSYSVSSLNESKSLSHTSLSTHPSNLTSLNQSSHNH